MRRASSDLGLMPDPSTELRAGSLRLFVAIELPGEVREALSRLQHELQRHGLEKLRWVRPEGIHLTLKFLGATAADRVPEIEEALARAATAVKPDQVTLGGLGMFGNRRSPRVLWIGVQSVPGVFDLYTRIEDELSTQGFPAEQRPFSPHLTLARVRPEFALEVRPAMVAAIDAVSAPHGIIPVREVSLMRSTLRPSGAIYDPLAAFPLGGGSDPDL
jgi:2'-5' RNA ligase